MKRFVNSRKPRTRNAGHPLCELLPHGAICQLAMCRNKTDKSASERLAVEARLKPVVVSLPRSPFHTMSSLSFSHSRRTLNILLLLLTVWLRAKRGSFRRSPGWQAEGIAPLHLRLALNSCPQKKAEKKRRASQTGSDPRKQPKKNPPPSPPKERGGEEFERLVAEVERAFLSFFVVWCAVPGARVQ